MGILSKLKPKKTNNAAALLYDEAIETQADRLKTLRSGLDKFKSVYDEQMLKKNLGEPFNKLGDLCRTYAKTAVEDEAHSANFVASADTLAGIGSQHNAFVLNAKQQVAEPLDSWCNKCKNAESFKQVRKDYDQLISATKNLKTGLKSVQYRTLDDVDFSRTTPKVQKLKQEFDKQLQLTTEQLDKVWDRLDCQPTNALWRSIDLLRNLSENCQGQES